MRTFKKVRGAPVFCGENLWMAGEITDFLFEEEANRLTGFWLSSGKWWRGARVIPIEKLYKSDTGFIISDASVLRKPVKNDCRGFNGKKRLHGRTVTDSDGETAGIIEDVYFLPDSGTITGYEVTEGLLEDMTRGVRKINTEPRVVYSEDGTVTISGKIRSESYEMPELRRQGYRKNRD